MWRLDGTVAFRTVIHSPIRLTHFLHKGLSNSVFPVGGQLTLLLPLLRLHDPPPSSCRMPVQHILQSISTSYDRRGEESLPVINVGRAFLLYRIQATFVVPLVAVIAETLPIGVRIINTLANAGGRHILIHL